MVVLADCDLEEAVESCVSGAFWAAGQNCIGVQRIYVEEGVFSDLPGPVRGADRCDTRWVPKLDEDCDMGPLITETEARRVEGWVEAALAAGATLECGHKREGATYRPTVLTGVDGGMKVDCEEIFGPVVNLYPVKEPGGGDPTVQCRGLRSPSRRIHLLLGLGLRRRGGVRGGGRHRKRLHGLPDGRHALRRNQELRAGPGGDPLRPPGDDRAEDCLSSTSDQVLIGAPIRGLAAGGRSPPPADTGRGSNLSRFPLKPAANSRGRSSSEQPP